jgi:hypothetical protein
MTDTSRSANQSKAEPFPAGPTESETETPAGDHPQQPGGALPTGASGAGDARGVPATGTEPAPGTSEQLLVVQGLHTPDVDESDPRT